MPCVRLRLSIHRQPRISNRIIYVSGRQGTVQTENSSFDLASSFFPAAKYLKQGDKIGWGILFPEGDDAVIGEKKEQLIICYLTVNRTVGYVRVLFQPVGGLYPVVIAPPNGKELLSLAKYLCFVSVNRIQMDFTATRISTEDFTSEQVKTILADARQQIEEENSSIHGTREILGEKFRFAIL